MFICLWWIRRREEKRLRKNVSAHKKHSKSKWKIGWLDNVNLWFVQHSTIANILDASVLLFSALGILYLLYGTPLIPSPYRELHYSFPLYLNIISFFWWMHLIIFSFVPLGKTGFPCKILQICFYILTELLVYSS